MELNLLVTLLNDKGFPHVKSEAWEMAKLKGYLGLINDKLMLYLLATYGFLSQYNALKDSYDQILITMANNESSEVQEYSKKMTDGLTLLKTKTFEHLKEAKSIFEKQ